MKRKALCMFLAAEAVLVCLAVWFRGTASHGFSGIFAFPFEQAALGLQRLASLGAAGRGLALALMAGLCLLPLVPVLRTAGDSARKGENIALAALSASLFAALFCMSTPAALAHFCVGGDTRMASGVKLALGCTVWSVAGCWLVLWLLRLFRTGKRRQLMSYLERMLCAACALFVACGCVESVPVLAESLRKAQLPADGFFAVLRFVLCLLPYAADIIVAFSAMELVQKLGSEGSSESAVESARSLSSVSAKTLAVVVASGALFNIIQLAAAPILSDISTRVQLPVLSLVFVLAALLLSRLIAENKRLAEDNGLFI